MALDNAPLGKASKYPDTYDPGQLFPLPRLHNRQRIGLQDGLWPWFGGDLWQAWEVSWLRPGGVPVVVWAEIEFAADSPQMVESKSLKLYLNSLNQTVYASVERACEVMALWPKGGRRNIS
jgi:7-cyano-7-deazaguanine reductase